MLKFFCLTLVLTSFAFAQTSVTPAGTGTSANPYQIDSLPNLYWLSQTSSAWDDTLVQTSDIDASKTSGWASNSGFSPIGNMSSTPFTGSYNGQGHIITGLTINRSEATAVGFFGYVSGGKIDSLGLSGATVTGGTAVGIVVGYLDQGTLSNSYATGSASGGTAVGGLAGYFQGTIAQSFSLADVSGTMAIGGLVGYGISGTLSTSYFAGIVDGNSLVNGLIACNAGVSVHASFWDSTGAGLAISSDAYARNTALMQTQTTFSDSGWNFASTWSIEAASNMGYPYLQGVPIPKVTTWRVTNIFKDSATVSAFSSWPSALSRGFCWNTTGSPTLVDSKLVSTTALTTSAFSANVSGLTEGITYYLRAYAISGTDTVYGNILVFTTPKLEGAGTPSNPYLVSSYGDLRMVGVGAHSLSASYRLTNDIDASSSTSDNGGAGMFPIGSDTKSFTGNFHGAGYAISNMQMNWQGNSYVGLFGYALNSLIDSLGLKNITVKGFETVGALAGYCSDCKISASYVTGGAIYSTTTGAKEIRAGGLVGVASYDTIKESSFAGTITVSGSDENSFVGGLLGYAYTTVVRNSYAEATATLTNSGSMMPYLGGLIGRGQNILIDQSHSNSTLSNTGSFYAYSGGLVGWVYDVAAITTSYASGSVSAIVTNGSSYAAYAGGLVGTAKNLSVDKSFAQNSVNAYNSVASNNNPVIYSGGLVGYHQNGHIANSYSTGSISASALTVGAGSSINATIYQGGLVGFGDGDSISLSYGVNAFSHTISASGTASANVGGILGKGSSSVVTKSFWNSSRAKGINGCGSGSCGASGLDSAAMLLTLSFSDFDFSSAWIQYDGYTFPLIRSLMTPLTVTANDTLRSYDGVPFTGGNGVRYSTTYTSSLISGTLEYDGTSQGAIDTGTYSLTVSGLYSTQLGYAIDFEPGSLRIDPKKLSLAGLSVENKTYDGTTDATFSGSASLDPDGILTGESVSLTGTASATFADKNVGSDKEVFVTGYSLFGDDASNYSIDSATFTADITTKSLTITDVTASDKVYDATTTATLTSGTLTGVVTGDAVTLTKGTGTFANANVGTDKTVTAKGYAISGTSATNYVLAAQPSGLKADITTYPITVIARDTSKVYGASDPVFPYSATALLGKDKWSGALSRKTGTQVGTYDILIGTLDAGDNYEISFNSAIFSIVKATAIEPAQLASRSRSLSLLQNSGAEMRFAYTTPNSGNVTIEFLSLRGQKRFVVECGAQNAGVYTATVESENLSTGKYTAVLRVNGNVIANTIVTRLK